nr:DUF4212 domain-containing protein [Phytoactinopolyspora halophila]
MATRTDATRDDGPPSGDWRREYWRRNLRLMAVLLCIWFIVSFGAGILFVDVLNELTIFGYPLGFWFAQQGSIYTFILLILIYALRMDRLDDKFGVSERDEDAGGDTGMAAGHAPAEAESQGAAATGTAGATADTTESEASLDGVPGGAAGGASADDTADGTDDGTGDGENGRQAT